MGYKYLHRRNGVYYFWMRVPQYCIEQFGYPFIRKSLKTTSKVEAQRIGHILMLYMNELFVKVKCGMLTDEKIHEIVSKIFSMGLAGFEEFRIEEPETASQVEKHIANFPKAKLRELLRQNSTDFFISLANLALEDEGIPIEPDSLQYKKYLRELLKMFGEICPIESERSDGNFMNEYDKHFSYTATAGQGFKTPNRSKPTINISQLYDKFSAEQKTAGNWMPKTELDYQSYFVTCHFSN